jgi:hypothetical protein
MAATAGELGRALAGLGRIRELETESANDLVRGALPVPRLGGGVELRGLSYAYDPGAPLVLRSIDGVVPQDGFLFDASVAENIGDARPGAARREIRAAARMAHCDEFVEQLPRGYDTVLGERGMTLPGGQRQRVAIARGAAYRGLYERRGWVSGQAADGAALAAAHRTQPARTTKHRAVEAGGLWQPRPLWA